MMTNLFRVDAPDAARGSGLAEGAAQVRNAPVRRDGDDRARATAVDAHLAGGIRARRTALGLSRQQFAGMLGVTYQQACRYERGVSPIAVARLCQIAACLDVSPSWFFEGLYAQLPEPGSESCQRALELMRSFAGIYNKRHCRSLLQMARALAAQSLAHTLAAVPVQTMWCDRAGDVADRTC